MVLALAPENTDTAAACVPKPAASVNVGLSAVAVSVGASFTGTTVTVEVGALLSSVPSFTVQLIVRLLSVPPAVGSLLVALENETRRNAAW